MGCERCKSSKVKAAQGMYLDKKIWKLDDKTLTAHLKIVRDALAEIPFRFRWMLFNRAIDKLIEDLKAEHVHFSLRSAEEGSFDPI